MALDEIVFDAFAGGYLPLPQASNSTIEQLRDVIRPIYQPVYDLVEGRGWLDDDDLVIGYSPKGSAYAYQLKTLNYHEIVNDYIDGVPLLVSHCSLCASASTNRTWSCTTTRRAHTGSRSWERASWAPSPASGSRCCRR
jgi:hypothetical protein